MSTDTLLSTAKLKMYAVCNGNTDSGVFFWGTKLDMILSRSSTRYHCYLQ